MEKQEKLDVIDKQIRSTQEIKNKHDITELKKFIVPVLFDGNLFKNSREEFRKEIEAFYDPDDVEAICNDERPDALQYSWNKFGVAFMLNWNLEFDQLYVSDYLTKQMTDEDPEELLKAAIRNLVRTEMIVRSISVKQLSPETKVYEIFMRNPCIPPYVNSILMSDIILGDLYRKFKTDLYFVPFYKDRLYMITGSSLNKPDILKIILTVPNELSEHFTSKVFCYNEKDKLKEI